MEVRFIVSEHATIDQEYTKFSGDGLFSKKFERLLEEYKLTKSVHTSPCNEVVEVILFGIKSNRETEILNNLHDELYDDLSHHFKLLKITIVLDNIRLKNSVNEMISGFIISKYINCEYISLRWKVRLFINIVARGLVINSKFMMLLYKLYFFLRRQI